MIELTIWQQYAVFTMIATFGAMIFTVWLLIARNPMQYPSDTKQTAKLGDLSMFWTPHPDNVKK